MGVTLAVTHYPGDMEPGETVGNEHSPTWWRYRGSVRREGQGDQRSPGKETEEGIMDVSKVELEGYTH